MGAKIRQGAQFGNLMRSEVEQLVFEACLDPVDEQIAKGYYIRHDATEDIAAEVCYCRATISRRLHNIAFKMDLAARRLGLIK